MNKQKQADIELFNAVQSVNGFNPVYSPKLKEKWEKLNGYVVQKYKEAYNLPNDFWLEDCVKHYNNRHS